MFFVADADLYLRPKMLQWFLLRLMNKRYVKNNFPKNEPNEQLNKVDVLQFQKYTFCTRARGLKIFYLSFFLKMSTKEIQIILRLFLVHHLLLQTKSASSQPASDVGGLVIH